ncbi:MAG: glycoside hydrolase/phage tail family protein [Pseudomonadota bacterium]
MATLVLAAAGSAIGGAIGGTVLGVSAATVGQAVGAVAGGFIDQAIIGRGSRAVEHGRARNLRLQTSTEGAPVTISYGRMRLAGTVIWSTRFLETVRSSSQGGKATGGQRVREYSYSISLAVALGEGPIDRIGRVWADGKEIDLSTITHRVYKGDFEQLPDPKIEAVEGAGNVPAYRGTAYVVFEDLPIGPYGNRIPQLNFEVFRGVDPEDLGLDPEVFGKPLPKIVKGIALSPGTGEHALHAEAQRYEFPGGATQAANVHNAALRPDIEVALDQLQAELPTCETVSLIVSWFGDDLRVGRCSVQPKIEIAGRASGPDAWMVAGLDSSSAAVVSVDEDERPNYGGTPSDASVISAIRSLTARGLKVMIYPFLLMDVEPGNALTDPYTGAAGQPAFPWRGRITLEAAPGEPGSTDKTAAAAGEVAAFFGNAQASHFSLAGGAVSYSGPVEWTWRRFVLHLAALAQAAGGVEALCIGSEFRGITTIRDGAVSYPAVAELQALAAEVRALLPTTKLSYAADWSEYFGHRPADGSGDALFHLDPLWADANTDFIGIDDYMSAADWRHGGGLDAAAGWRSTHSLPYLRANVAGGENYDWYYADEDARIAQDRTPIVDTAHGEDWIFRPKDLVNWWSEPHFDRPGGVRAAAPTAWVPQSKPIWLTETGCPAVDLGANRPNLFIDPKSSESALPTGSTGARDDEMQRRFLQAKIMHWEDPANNPVSSVYGAPMLPVERIHVWTWDARPWPDFPIREDVWSDGANHRLGHWITGRVSASGLAEVVAAVCVRAGLAPHEFDVSDLVGAVHGYAIERTRSAREALQPLMTTYGFDAFESGGRIVFRMRSGGAEVVLAPERLIEGAEPGQAVALSRGTAGDLSDIVRLGFVQAEADYRVGMAEAIRPGGAGILVDESSVPIAFPASVADGIAARWLAEGESARDAVSFAVPPSEIALEPGDVVGIEGVRGVWRIEGLTLGAGQEAVATRVDPALYVPRASQERRVSTPAAVLPGPLDLAFLDLPLADGGAEDHRPRLAVLADPWPGSVDLYTVDAEAGFGAVGTQRVPAIAGVLTGSLPGAAPDLPQRVSLSVAAPDGAFEAVGDAALLDGANRAALIRADGSVEMVQFRDAVLTGSGAWTLGHLLRGQRGTEALAGVEAAPGTRLVLVDRGLFTLPLDLEALGRETTWRAVPAGKAPDDPEAADVTAAAAGAGLKPFAPAHLRAFGAAGTDIAISWIRRTRVGGDSWFAAEVPLGEEREAYALRITKSGAVLRVEETTAPAFTYTAAMQAADGATAPFEVDVAQISTVLGAGSRRSVTIHG